MVNEFEKKFRKFMESEKPGHTYQAVIVYTNNKIAPGGSLEIQSQTIGFDTSKVPFMVAHSIFKSLEATTLSMLKKIYGSEMRFEEKRKDSNMHM